MHKWLNVNPLGLLTITSRTSTGVESSSIRIEDILTHIRQEPKELTELKALAEKLGFELTKKD